MDATSSFELLPIGFVRSRLTRRSDAPCQGSEGAPDAELEILPEFNSGLQGLQAGHDVWILTWLHQSKRSTLKVHPRDELTNPETGVFSTRSADRPNPIGLHRVSVVRVEGARVIVRPLEAIDGTPVLDIKPVIEGLLLSRPTSHVDS